MTTGIDVKGDEELISKFQRLPVEVAFSTVDEASKYMLLFRDYPPEKRVSRKQAYPNLSFVTATGKRIVGYKSLRQFRLVMAKVANGEVPYNRTKTLRNNWKRTMTQNSATLTNATPYAGYVLGDNTQSRHAKMIGWQTISEMIESRKPTLIQKIQLGVQKAFRKLGFR